MTQANIKKRGKRYLVKKQVRGVIYQPSFATEKEAVKWVNAATRAQELELDVPCPDDFRTISDHYRLKQFAEKYARTLWESEEWRLKCIASIKEASELLDNPLVKDIDEDMLIDLVDVYESKNNSGSTINRKLTAISKVLSFAKRKGVVNEVCHIPKQKESKGRLRFLSEQEYKTLLQFCDKWDNGLGFRELTEYLVKTGCRISEALNQEWRDIDLDTGAVHVWMNKTDKPRTVYVEPEFIQGIYKDSTASGPFFEVSSGSYRSWLKKVTDDAGIVECTPHTFRHTCASWLVQRGVGLPVVKDWMGHTTIVTTMRYAHLRAVDMEQCRSVLNVK